MGGWIDMELKACELIIHHHDCYLCVTMVVWIDVLYSDWGDFRCRRAVDISSWMFTATRVYNPHSFIPLCHDSFCIVYSHFTGYCMLLNIPCICLHHKKICQQQVCIWFLLITLDFDLYFTPFWNALTKKSLQWQVLKHILTLYIFYDFRTSVFSICRTKLKNYNWKWNWRGILSSFTLPVSSIFQFQFQFRGCLQFTPAVAFIYHLSLISTMDQCMHHRYLWVKFWIDAL